MPLTILDETTKTAWDGTLTVDEMFDNMNNLELQRFIETLRIHMQSNLGKNDIVVNRLLEIAEYNQLRRD